MTDCYICGHPILEGQKTQDPRPHLEWSHLNPADHLPTLIDDSYLGAYAVAWKRKERERAAGMVLATPMLGADACVMMKRLAARIRKGD